MWHPWQGWLAIGGVVLVWDWFAIEGNTLTDGGRRAFHHPHLALRWLTRGALVVTALHLADYLPRQIDPWGGIAFTRKVFRHK